jgi:hypothetical protein
LTVPVAADISQGLFHSFHSLHPQNPGKFPFFPDRIFAEDIDFLVFLFLGIGRGGGIGIAVGIGVGIGAVIVVYGIQIMHVHQSLPVCLFSRIKNRGTSPGSPPACIPFFIHSPAHR